MDIAKFRNPPTEYREVPFWSWNDELRPDELRRQIGLMEQAGWGGFFMHARVGLLTPYLGEQWRVCVHECVAEAGRRGMGAWLYDEDKWPSGFAGGLTVAGHPEFRDQCLACKVDNKPALIAERIATFVAREQDGLLRDFRPDDSPRLARDDERVVQFYPQAMPLGQPWFNDYAYISVLDPEAVRAFIESTHARYADWLAPHLGKSVPGIFTDEPQLRFYRGRQAIPWTRNLAELFRSDNGYDLLPHLPSLFFDTGDYHRVRYDFWRTITKRFVDSYSRQIYQWCEAKGLAYTGHLNSEDSLLSQIELVGTAMMPHYAWMHIPGVDKLCRTINEGQGTVLTFKQLDSVVCQLGKPRALCENYGCNGQDFAHTGRKWIGDWSYVLGVNLNNPHLALYSMRGERKRDYPQNLFYQQPWWPENRLVADYFARLSYALASGQRVAEILVIHPIGSAWSVYKPGATTEVRALDRALDSLLLALMRHHRDFHLGDEMLMEPGAPCEARVGRDEHGPLCQVGQMVYRLLIVPPGVTLAENTVRLLREFAAAGGPVLALEPTPTLIAGRAPSQPVLPPSARTVTLEALSEALDELLSFDVRIPGCPNIWVHHRREGDQDLYFFANTDLENGCVASVQLRGTGRLESWDPVTGAVQPIPAEERGGITELALEFAPAGSHLLVLHRGKPPARSERSTPRRTVSRIPLADSWELELAGPNALVLDSASLQIAEGPWSAPMHILDAHGAVAAAGLGTPFRLRFVFDAAVLPQGPLHLVVESPEQFSITVNGRPVRASDCGWWTDISFRRLDVTGAVQAGRNEIQLSGTFTRVSELESVYLIGSFGVEARRLREENRCNGQIFDRYAPEFRLVELPQRVEVKPGPRGAELDLTAQGLPFFAGRLKLRQRVSVPRAGAGRLEIEGLRAAVAHVHANGKEAGVVAWPPHRLEIPSLEEGENLIEIELVGTLRNLLGPHHRSGGDTLRTGPSDFRDKSRWTEDVILVPFGFRGALLETIV